MLRCPVILLLLLAFHIGCEANPDRKPNNKAKAIITKKLKSATPAQLNTYREDAAKIMVIDLQKAFEDLLKSNSNAPQDMKTVLDAMENGELTPTLSKSIPSILQKASNHQGKSVEQLQTVLGIVLPNAPKDLGAPIQGTFNFLSANLNGLSNVVGKVVGGVPDLLEGTIKSLSGNLGAVTEAVNGSVASLGTLLGGLLNG